MRFSSVSQSPKVKKVKRSKHTSRRWMTTCSRREESSSVKSLSPFVMSIFRSNSRGLPMMVRSMIPRVSGSGPSTFRLNQCENFQNYSWNKNPNCRDKNLWKISSLKLIFAIRRSRSWPNQIALWLFLTNNRRKLSVCVNFRSRECRNKRFKEFLSWNKWRIVFGARTKTWLTNRLTSGT